MAPCWALVDARWAFSPREQARWWRGGGRSLAVDQAQPRLRSADSRLVLMPLFLLRQPMSGFGPTDYPMGSASGSGPSSYSLNTAKVFSQSVETAEPGWEDDLLKTHFPYVEKQLTNTHLDWSCRVFLKEVSWDWTITPGKLATHHHYLQAAVWGSQAPVTRTRESLASPALNWIEMFWEPA